MPSSAAITSAMPNAAIIGHDPSESRVIRTGRLSECVGKKSTHGRYSCPRFHAASNVNMPYMASAPWAKLMTPEPL